MMPVIGGTEFTTAFKCPYKILYSVNDFLLGSRNVTNVQFYDQRGRDRVAAAEFKGSRHGRTFYGQYLLTNIYLDSICSTQ